MLKPTIQEKNHLPNVLQLTKAAAFGLMVLYLLVTSSQYAVKASFPALKEKKIIHVHNKDAFDRSANIWFSHKKLLTQTQNMFQYKKGITYLTSATKSQPISSPMAV
jgi:hypothetical protein